MLDASNSERLFIKQFFFFLVSFSQPLFLLDMSTFPLKPDVTDH